MKTVSIMQQYKCVEWSQIVIDFLSAQQVDSHVAKNSNCNSESDKVNLIHQSVFAVLDFKYNSGQLTTCMMSYDNLDMVVSVCVC